MGYDERVLTGIGVLAAVTAAGAFARAAETLGLTPSGLSWAVARLEERVGVRPFDRTPRSVTLTEEGVVVRGRDRYRWSRGGRCARDETPA